MPGVKTDLLGSFLKLPPILVHGRTMRKILTSIAFFVTPLLLSGCSLFGSSSPSGDDAQAVQERALIEARVAPEAPKQGIEVTWEVPSESVDGFIIRYGSTPSSLSKEVTISATDIREERDPEFGPVYRYLIRDVGDADRLFVSIAAVKGQTISNFSEVLEAQPDKRSRDRAAATQ